MATTSNQTKPDAALVQPAASGEIEAGKGSTPDPDLPMNARSAYDKDLKKGPHAVSPQNPKSGAGR